MAQVLLCGLLPSSTPGTWLLIPAPSCGLPGPGPCTGHSHLVSLQQELLRTQQEAVDKERTPYNKCKMPLCPKANRILEASSPSRHPGCAWASGSRWSSSRERYALTPLNWGQHTFSTRFPKSKDMADSKKKFKDIAYLLKSNPFSQLFKFRVNYFSFFNLISQQKSISNYDPEQRFSKYVGGTGGVVFQEVPKVKLFAQHSSFRSTWYFSDAKRPCYYNSWNSEADRRI